jgi:hypothetical protein
VYCSGEGLARRPVLVSFGVEEIFEVGVLVGELVALQAGLFCERDYVEPA